MPKSLEQPATQSDQQEAVAEDEPEVDEDMLLCGRVAGRPPARENLSQAVGGGGELEPEHSGAVLAHLSKRRKLGSAENEHHDRANPQQTLARGSFKAARERCTEVSGRSLGRHGGKMIALIWIDIIIRRYGT